MEYFSTRGGDERLSFEETVLAGLAPNAGLYIPATIPSLPPDWQSAWADLSFTDLALEIYSLYIHPSEISRQELSSLIQKSYASFTHPLIAPIHPLSPNSAVLELWHGPTFAFKDVALQFLGNLFEFFLARKNAARPPHLKQRITVLGATSGDTGSAAIYGLRGKTDLSIFILHPKGRVSPIQEAQMTTVLDPNVFNLAVEGTFDDCQDIVKSIFSDQTFKHEYQLGAINSINWARILAQIVYYFSSYFQMKRKSSSNNIKLQYVVPTGNFGDILAGFYAFKMGLPIGSKEDSCPGLVIATNANDILTRFWETGAYEKSPSKCPEDLKKTDEVNPTEPVIGGSDGKQATSSSQHGNVKETLSPAMDILVSSNFERLIFHLAFETLTSEDQTEIEKIRNAQSQVNEWMNQLKTKSRFQVPSTTLSLAREIFKAGRATDLNTCETIRSYFERNGDDRYIVDPHTAVGLYVAKQQQQTNPKDIFQIILATAHPAKFSDAVNQALKESKQISNFNFNQDVLPEAFKGLLDLPRKIINVNGIEIEKTKEVVIREVDKLFGGK